MRVAVKIFLILIGTILLIYGLHGFLTASYVIKNGRSSFANQLTKYIAICSSGIILLCLGIKFKMRKKDSYKRFLE